MQSVAIPETGQLSASSINFNVGNSYNVTLSTGMLSGNLIGTGSAISLTANNSNITLGNITASNSVAVTANGNILASTPANTAISSPSIALTATGGNIGGNTTGTTALLANSGGTSGLTLFFNATTVSSNGGVVNISDTSAENLIVNNNNPSSSNAAVSATLAANGNIYAGPSVGPAITSPTISLTAAGNIGGNSAGTTAFQVYSNSSGVGLNLTASGNVVNILDSLNESISVGTCNINNSFTLASTGNGTITFNNNVGGANCTLIDINAAGAGNILDAGPGTYALNAPTGTVNLLTATGRIGTPGLRVNCIALSANTAGTNVAAGDDSVHINDLATSTVTLNASSGGNGSNDNFTFVTTSNIIIAGNVTGNTVFIATTSGASGSITVNSTASVGNYTVGGHSTTSLLAYGSGFIEDSGSGTNVVQGNTLNFSSLNNGQIGAPGLRVIGDVINANTSGQVHLNNIGTQPVTFTGVTGGAGLFQVLSSSAITVTGAIAAPSVFVEVTSGNGGITIDSTVGSIAAGTVYTQVIANGGGTITTGVGGLIQGASIIVSSVSGSVGTSGSAVAIAGNSSAGANENITLNAGTGLINVSNTFTGTGTVTLAGASARYFS